MRPKFRLMFYFRYPNKFLTNLVGPSQSGFSIITLDQNLLSNCVTTLHQIFWTSQQG
eukprot:m.1369943 g.1369943  ORF g.1369943 m.1369943 type:complete len:57 (+) comp24955_c1_seq42:5924-6094(+)